VAALRAEPESSALLLDIDGTLAPIAPTPESAQVPAETRGVLESLARDYELIVCISGRQAADARRLVGIESIGYSGNHGIEYLAPRAQAVEVDPRIGEATKRVRAFAKRMFDDRLAAAGVRFEDKQSVCAFHWRGASDEFAARARLEEIAVAARREGLLSHWGRKVLEIRPDVEINKGTAVANALTHTAATQALYAGDDTTDLDAFSRLRDMKSAGLLNVAVCVGVISDETPPPIAENADLTVNGTAGMFELLQKLER